jgi:hypothetical protein
MMSDGMGLDTFVFTITLPPDPSYLEVFGPLAEQLSRYIGLPPEEASQAGGVLTRSVADRIRQLGADGGPVTITFERPHGAGAVTVDVVSADPQPAGPVPPGGPLATRADGRLRLRLSWQGRNGA